MLFNPNPYRGLTKEKWQCIWQFKKQMTRVNWRRSTRLNSASERFKLLLLLPWLFCYCSIQASHIFMFSLASCFQLKGWSEISHLQLSGSVFQSQCRPGWITQAPIPRSSWARVFKIMVQWNCFLLFSPFLTFSLQVHCFMLQRVSCVFMDWADKIRIIF